MQRAIEETERRRNKQIAFNIEHGIEPRSIIKGISDVMEGARDANISPSRRGAIKSGERQAAALDPAATVVRIDALEKKMNKHAQNLEFEQAAKIRDEIRDLQERSFGFSK